MGGGGMLGPPAQATQESRSSGTWGSSFQARKVLYGCS